MQRDRGTFTPLVFSISDGMARKFQRFYSCLAQLLSETETFRSRFLVIGFEQKVCLGLLK